MGPRGPLVRYSCIALNMCVNMCMCMNTGFLLLLHSISFFIPPSRVHLALLVTEDLLDQEDSE